jgi:hypothetical protein
MTPRRKRPLRVPVGPLPSPYRLADRLRDPHGVSWVVVGVDGEAVSLRTAGGAMELERTAEQLADWTRWA